MKIVDIISLSTRMFKTRPLRTFLTVLGVSVGIGAVLFLVSLGYGLQQVVLNKITTADSLLTLDVSPGVTDLININKEDIDDISEIENVELVSPVINLTAQLSIDEFTASNTANIIEPSFFRLSGVETKFGKIPEESDIYGIVLSSIGAELFGLEPEEMIDREIKISLFVPIEGSENNEINVSKREETYIVRGIVEDDSSNYMYISSEAVKDLGINEFDNLKVKISKNEYMEEIRQEIIDKGFLVSSISDIIEQTNKIFEIVQLILAIFGLIALIVSAIGMVNTMTISLLERINEIGIMRAIGITKKDIRIIFLTESIVMGFLGGIGGVIVGYAGGTLVNFGINMLAKTFGGQSLDLFYCPTWFIYFILVFSTFVGLLTGIYPSIKASRLNPLTALRYK